MIILTSLTVNDVHNHLYYLYKLRVPTSDFHNLNEIKNMKERFILTFQDKTHPFTMKGEKSNDPS